MMSYHHDTLQKYLVQNYFRTEKVGAAYIRSFSFIYLHYFMGRNCWFVMD